MTLPYVLHPQLADCPTMHGPVGSGRAKIEPFWFSFLALQLACHTGQSCSAWLDYPSALNVDLSAPAHSTGPRCASPPTISSGVALSHPARAVGGGDALKNYSDARSRARTRSSTIRSKVIVSASEPRSRSRVCAPQRPRAGSINDVKSSDSVRAPRPNAGDPTSCIERSRA